MSRFAGRKINLKGVVTTPFGRRGVMCVKVCSKYAIILTYFQISLKTSLSFFPTELQLILVELVRSISQHQSDIFTAVLSSVPPELAQTLTQAATIS